MSDKERVPVIIDDFKYFAMIDNQVRRKFAKFEVEQILPIAQMVLGRSEVPNMVLKDYPIEGYYYKSEALKYLFKLIRNFQQNEEVYRKLKHDNELASLKNVYETDLFGTEVPPGEDYPWPDAPLKRRWDILTHTMQDKSLFDNYAVRPWTIQTVLDAVKKKFSGQRNLPELAAMIGSAELICAACETNSLGRMYAMLTGSYSMLPPPPRFIWKVTPAVEALGKEICFRYNQVVGIRVPIDDEYTVYAPTLKLCEMSDDGMLNPPLDWTLERPRVCHLGYVIEPDLNYFWILDNQGGLTDLYQKEMLTTEEYKKRTMGDEYKWAYSIGIAL